MRNNEADNSIRFIRTGVPDFTRRIFELYVRHQIIASDSIEAILLKSPLKANESITGIHKLPFIDYYKDINSEGALELHRTLQDIICTNTNAGGDSHTAEDSIADGDIYSPIKSIKPIITTFSITNYNNIVPAIYIAPCMGYSTGFTPSPAASDIGMLYHDDINGSASIFDELCAHVYIDVNHLMTKFLMKLIDKIGTFKLHNITIDTNNSNNEPTNINRNCVKDFISLKEVLTSNDEFNIEIISSIVNDISVDLTKSATLTYLAYYGRLIGSKTNFFEWINGVFMKDLINKLDADTLLTSNVSDISDKDHYSADSDNTYKALNQTQLGFVNWSFVIDTVIHCNTNRASNSKKNKYAIAANTALELLLENSYTTYNTLLYIGKNGPDSIKSILEIAIKRVYEYDNLCYLKDLKRDGDVNYILRNNSNEPNGTYKYDNAVLVNTNYTTRILADIFIKFAYLTLLNYSYEKIDNLVDENEFYTGKSKREMLNEKFNSVLTDTIRVINLVGRNDNYKIRKIINGSTYRFELDKRNAEITNLVDNRYSGVYDLADNEYNEVYNNNDDIDINEAINIYRYLYDIRPNTYIYRLRNHINCIGIKVKNNYSNDDDEIISGIKFNNTVTDTLINKTNNLFTLESLEQAVEDFEENATESEWAYGNYNALAGLSSNVIQITNEADNKAFNGPTIDDMTASQNLDELKDTAAESYKTRINKLNARVNNIIIRKFK